MPFAPFFVNSVKICVNRAGPADVVIAKKVVEERDGFWYDQTPTGSAPALTRTPLIPNFIRREDDLCLTNSPTVGS
jgi:hypothetical protein